MEEVDNIFISKGVLKKWTNYVNGWQERYFEIVNGNIVYFKAKSDKCFGCRGSICLKNANITEHEFDECEFTVSVGSSLIWYLKADNRFLKERWMRAITKDGDDSDYSSTSTKTHSRNLSSLSSTDTCNNIIDTSTLFASRVAELEAYRTMCCDQMTSLQRLLESDSSATQSKLLSLKATHIAMLSNINHIIELIKTGKVHLPDSPTHCSAAIRNSLPALVHNTRSPDNDNDSESTLKGTPSTNVSATDATSGDEWHDADDHSSFGSVDLGVEVKSSTPSSSRCSSSEPQSSSDRSEDKLTKEQPCSEVELRNLPFGHYDILEMPRHHTMFDFVDTLALEQLKYALAGVEDNVWSLFAGDGAMRMYTREVQDEGGLPVDPLKAVHQVKGVTALEFMHHFYEATFKKDWDHTLDDMKVVEEISKDTIVLHQKHKTVWPAAPRESLFVSHIRRVDHLKPANSPAHDLYIVCNKDITRSDVPLASSSSVRVGLTVSMICETVILNKKPLAELSRNDIQCNITYVSRVHPGGWVPVAALRHVYKKEYPKFLRTFTDFVVKRVKGKPAPDFAYGAVVQIVSAGGSEMRRFRLFALLLIFIFFVGLFEELIIGKVYVSLMNSYQREVLIPIHLPDIVTKGLIGVVIVVADTNNWDQYSLAISSVRCYCILHNYSLHIIDMSRDLHYSKNCVQKDIMFRRHCVFAEALYDMTESWLLFLDADMAVINPKRAIEDFVPTNSSDHIVLYQRIFNHEIMAGSYLLRNNHFSNKFLRFWANYEFLLPNSFHGTDNGALHMVIAKFYLTELSNRSEHGLEEEVNNCARYWNASTDYDTLSVYEVCIQVFLSRHPPPHIKILSKGHAWARDGWLTNSAWSDSDLFIHGWQKRRRDKLRFARWHSPLVNEDFNVSLCSNQTTAHLNWRYKDSFIISPQEAQYKIDVVVRNVHSSFEDINRTILTA